jgi:hypothetical protein
MPIDLSELVQRELDALAALLPHPLLSRVDWVTLGGAVEALQRFKAAPTDSQEIEGRLEDITRALRDERFHAPGKRKLAGAGLALLWLLDPAHVEAPSRWLRPTEAPPKR